MKKKTDVTFIREEVQVEVEKNPNGLMSIPFANKMENYLRKSINTKGPVAKSIITDLMDVQYQNKKYFLSTFHTTMFSIAEYSQMNINKH
tara:strand:+ start:2687 stop:2956 length:270 start_codon:yes stop_codon:yes gene_type:complete